MSKPDTTSLTTDERVRRNTRWFLIVAALVIVLVFGGMLALVQWAQNRQAARQPASQGTEFTDYRGPWASAMAKAGVEATFPAGPVELTELKASGRKDFSATFTPEEIAALVAVYHYSSDAFGAGVAFSDLKVAFPEPGRGSLEGKIQLDGSTYKVSASAPTSYANGSIVLRLQGAELRVEGFGVGGDRKTQAIDALGDYLNALLDAAPGLDVESAEITAAGVSVKGAAPTRLENPPPPADRGP
ncbi:MAG TPA: hypothetical protein VLA05_04675 [Coriobacteriia bacterium]|nr:hypothetical protein [Coriobacteriia bacterium]